MSFQPNPVPFTRADLPALKITAHALKHDPRYIQIVHGVWIDTTDDHVEPTPAWAGQKWIVEATRLRGIRLRRPDVIGTLWTAAVLYGLPLPNTLNDRALHVAGDTDCARISRPGVVLHRHRRLSRTDFFDLPLITLPHLFVEMGRFLNLTGLVQIGDAIISPNFTGPKTVLSELEHELSSRKQVRGRKHLEKALSLVRPTVDSPRETWLRLWIVDNGFPEPVVHPSVQCQFNGVVLHPDLGYPTIKLAIEYEGDHHRTSFRQFGSDIERRQLLEAEGWTVLRVTKSTNMAMFRSILAKHLGAEV